VKQYTIVSVYILTIVSPLYQYIHKSNTANISINGCIKIKETSVKIILKFKTEIDKKPHRNKGKTRPVLIHNPAVIWSMHIQYSKSRGGTTRYKRY